MRHSSVLFVGILCCFLSSVIGSFDGGYGATHDFDDHYEPSYPAPSIVHHPHHGHSAGSYYHYHVPLVGQQQQQHYQPYHQDHSHYLWPLLLLLALPLLFLPLLPLLLLPLGLSLLALLAPGGMMMMMMMMMMGGGMMMRTDTVSGRALSEMRTFGEVLLSDVTSLLTKYARSLDLDHCPQRVVCEAGAIFYPGTNSTDSTSAKAFTSFIVEQYIPKGRVRKAIKQFEKAFWSGSSSLGSCNVFSCQPTFRVYKQSGQDPSEKQATSGVTGSSSPFRFNASHSSDVRGTNGEIYNKNVNYIYASNSKANAIASNFVGQEILKPADTIDGDNAAATTTKLKSKRSHISHHRYYGTASKQKAEDSHIPHVSKSKYFNNMFGTPTVKS